MQHLSNYVCVRLRVARGETTGEKGLDLHGGPRQLPSAIAQVGIRRVTVLMMTYLFGF